MPHVTIKRSQPSQPSTASKVHQKSDPKSCQSFVVELTRWHGILRVVCLLVGWNSTQSIQFCLVQIVRNQSGWIGLVVGGLYSHMFRACFAFSATLA